MRKTAQKNTSDFVVCYETADGSRKFTHFVDPDYRRNGEVNITAFKMKYPDAQVIAFFSVSDNLLDKRTDEKTQFVNTCRNFGFEPEDYRRTISDNYGNHKYLLVGFLPQNTKYKARLFDKETGGYIKATLNFVMHNMIFRPDEV